MIVNVIEPKRGTVLDPACGSGGMFVASADFTENCGVHANTAMTFYGQEKVEYNAKLCIMNMAVHGLNAKIRWGDTVNSFYHDAHNLNGSCDFVMALKKGTLQQKMTNLLEKQYNGEYITYVLKAESVLFLLRNCNEVRFFT